MSEVRESDVKDYNSIFMEEVNFILSKYGLNKPAKDPDGYNCYLRLEGKFKDGSPHYAIYYI